MLDKIQEQFNRINAACVRLRANGHDKTLEDTLEELEIIGDDLERFEQNPVAPAADPTPATDPQT